MKFGQHIKAIFKIFQGMQLQRVAQPGKKRAPYERGERYDWCFACKQETLHSLMTRCGLCDGTETPPVVDICEMCCDLLDTGKRHLELDHDGNWLFLDD